ncbi:hypothetical protein BFJ72_g12201 [Fusarium proliferatum]|uniref:Uncharacterized protein n=1 Tax=Gibberella intermedia TaxID=948311 RepID=A0A420SI75_GIBIN|nr:hypothetical protein BFJ72_g12201 [Fusarium proliferatum]
MFVFFVVANILAGKVKSQTPKVRQRLPDIENPTKLDH